MQICAVEYTQNKSHVEVARNINNAVENNSQTQIIWENASFSFSQKNAQNKPWSHFILKMWL